MQMRGAVREGAEVKFYEDLDGHNMPTVWHDPNGDGYTPVPVLTKLHVPPGYWQEVVARLCADPPAGHIVATNKRLRERVLQLDKAVDVWRQRAIDLGEGHDVAQTDDLIDRYNLTLAWERSAHQTINMLNAENRA